MLPIFEFYERWIQVVLIFKKYWKKTESFFALALRESYWISQKCKTSAPRKILQWAVLADSVTFLVRTLLRIDQQSRWWNDYFEKFEVISKDWIQCHGKAQWFPSGPENGNACLMEMVFLAFVKTSNQLFHIICEATPKITLAICVDSTERVQLTCYCFVDLYEGVRT